MGILEELADSKDVLTRAEYCLLLGASSTGRAYFEANGLFESADRFRDDDALNKLRSVPEAEMTDLDRSLLEFGEVVEASDDWIQFRILSRDSMPITAFRSSDKCAVVRNLEFSFQFVCMPRSEFLSGFEQVLGACWDGDYDWTASLQAEGAIKALLRVRDGKVEYLDSYNGDSMTLEDNIKRMLS